VILRVGHVLNSPGKGGVPRVAEALIRRADRARTAPYLFCLKGGGAERASYLMNDLDIPRGTGGGGKGGAMIDPVSRLAANRINLLHSHSDKWADSALLAAERRLAGVTDAAIADLEAVAAHVTERVGTIYQRIAGRG